MEPVTVSADEWIITGIVVLGLLAGPLIWLLSLLMPSGKEKVSVGKLPVGAMFSNTRSGPEDCVVVSHDEYEVAKGKPMTQWKHAPTGAPKVFPSVRPVYQSSDGSNKGRLGRGYDRAAPRLIQAVAIPLGVSSFIVSAFVVLLLVALAVAFLVSIFR